MIKKRLLPSSLSYVRNYLFCLCVRTLILVSKYFLNTYKITYNVVIHTYSFESWVCHTYVHIQVLFTIFLCNVSHIYDNATRVLNIWRIFVGKVFLNLIFKLSFAIEQILLFSDEIWSVFRERAMHHRFVICEWPNVSFAMNHRFVFHKWACCFHSWCTLGLPFVNK